MDKKIIIGILTILIASSAVYITFSEDVRIRVDNDKTTFYVPHSEYNWIWTISGREYNRLFDGSSMMYRNVSGIEVNTSIEGNEIMITRKTPYIRGPIVIDKYYFEGNITDVELFPIKHTVNIINGSGYFYRYEVRDLEYHGDTYKLKSETELTFGKNMNVHLQEDYRWAWVYKRGIVKAQYDIKSNNETFNVRLFDPTAFSQYSLLWNITTDFDSNDETATVRFIDSDSDGSKDELAVANESHVIIYDSDGTKICTCDPPNGRKYFEVGDLDGDGYFNELVTFGANMGTCSGSSLIEVFEISGGSCTSKWSDSHADYCNQWSGVIGDFDGDGNQDDFVTMDYRGEPYMWNKTGSWTWSYAWEGATPPSSSGGGKVIKTDVDSDGTDDFVCVGGDMFAYYGNGTQIWNDSASSYAFNGWCDADEDGDKHEFYKDAWGEQALMDLSDGSDISRTTSNKYGRASCFVDIDDNGYTNDVIVPVDFWSSGNAYIRGYDEGLNQQWSYTTQINDERIGNMLCHDYGNGNETVIAGGYGWVYVLDEDGNEIQKFNLTGYGTRVGWGYQAHDSKGMDLGDIDGDGDDDLAVVLQEGYLFVYEAETSGGAVEEADIDIALNSNISWEFECDVDSGTNNGTPTGQNSSLATAWCENNGSASGDFQVRIDSGGSQNAGWTMRIDDDNSVADSLIINDSWQTFQSGISASTNVSNCAWFWVSCDVGTSTTRPAAIEFQAT